jgi:hypothetical protein
MALSVPILMSLSASALAARPSLSAHEGRINTLEGQVSALTTDMATLALTPGPQGDKGDTGAAGQAGATGQNGADGVMYDGAFEGDMQYWNGNAWIMITAPAENADSLSFCDGQPTWTQGGCPVVVVYEVGDTGPAGGIVFYVSNEGLNGLEAAPVDQGSAEWGCYGEIVPGAFSEAIGAGQANTDLILAHGCGITPVSGGVTMDAAVLTREYSLGGYSDWFLPSIGDLYLMYSNLFLNNLGGFSYDISYWSSSQRNRRHLAQTIPFVNEPMTYWMNKHERSVTVRAVRAF